jgi:hypothetical protein
MQTDPTRTSSRRPREIDGGNLFGHLFYQRDNTVTPDTRGGYQTIESYLTETMGS